MRSDNKYWIDENNNKWDKKDYTEDVAEYLSKTLYSCYFCTNCSFCILAQHCTGCTCCINIYSSSLLSNSIRCDRCHNCIKCIDCMNCKNQIKLINGKGIISNEFEMLKTAYTSFKTYIKNIYRKSKKNR